MAEEPASKENKEDEGRKRAHETERLEHLRERLYARGDGQEPTSPRHELERRPVIHEPLPHRVTPSLSVKETPPMVSRSSRKSFRSLLTIIGVVFFVGALALSSFFLFKGSNTISGSNISIDVRGPIAVGGGETMNLQVAIANQNVLPIESATLIVTYPRGAQSKTEPGKELFTDRKQLNNIGTNEVVNVPLEFFMFGEENDVKKIDISVEYRVQGSNATFRKEASPFEFKITSSPVIINIKTLEKISSGQEMDIELKVKSNSPDELKDLLVRAVYPQGFDFVVSLPDTSSGQDVWKIASLKTGEEKTIRITGRFVGREDEVNQFNFSVGVPSERDAFAIASTLATRDVSVSIERPFFDVEVSVNSRQGETLVINPGDPARIDIAFQNALDLTLYDGLISAKLGGSALNELEIKVDDGHYDSSKNTITWDAVDVRELRELIPGARQHVSFSLEPRKDIEKTPEISLTVTVEANRVGQNNVPERIEGIAKQVIKIASVTELASSVLYSESPFENSGPVPPVAEKVTEYAFLLTVRNATNPITDTEVTGVLPSYVTWLDQTSDEDAVTFNPTTRLITWDVGDLETNGYKEIWMHVALKPSLSQVGTIPTLLESQRLRATDRFTDTSVRSTAPALTTFLMNDPNPSIRDGRVLED